MSLYHDEDDESVDVPVESIQERTARLLERHKERVQNVQVTDAETEELKQKIRAKLEEHKKLLKTGRQNWSNGVDDTVGESESPVETSPTSSTKYGARGLGRAGREDHENIEDHLLERGRLKQEYREEQRLLREQMNSSAYTFQPQISETAKALNRPKVPIEVRMAREAQKAEDRKEMLRQQREQEEMLKQPTFTPTINKNLVVEMGPGSVVERTMAWEASKERKRLNSVHEQRLKESLQATHTPTINQRSARLVAGTRREDVATHLYKLAPVQRSEMRKCKKGNFRRLSLGTQRSRGWPLIFAGRAPLESACTPMRWSTKSAKGIESKKQKKSASNAQKPWRNTSIAMLKGQCEMQREMEMRPLAIASTIGPKTR